LIFSIFFDESDSIVIYHVYCLVWECVWCWYWCSDYIFLYKYEIMLFWTVN